MREDGSGERHQLHLGQAGDPPNARKRVNYNDLTATSLGIMVSIGNDPQMALIQVGELL